MAAKLKRKAKLSQNRDPSTLLPFSSAVSVLKAISLSPRPPTLSLFVKAKMGSGIPIPRGRYKLPREPKSKTEQTILVFAEGRQADDAKRAGAHIIGGIELCDGILSNRLRATTILCTNALIKSITPRLGRFLGPKGLMPSVRRGTVTDDIAGYIEKLLGATEWKGDQSGNIVVPFARVDWPISDIVKNYNHVMDSIKVSTGNVKQKDPAKIKAGLRVATLEKVMINTTQGPGVRIAEF
ncbi:ribosomal protein L1-like protein [Mucidula mucida]|nr:ribosomal protein L1-like protein [Mucidula mucida]